MNYVSFAFWTWFLALLLPWLLLRGLIGEDRAGPFDPWILLIISCVLFAAESHQSFFIFVAVGVLVYLSAKLLKKVPQSAQWTFILGVACLAFLPLIYFKYQGFLFGSAEEGFLDVKQQIPIGISFYTFQLVGLLVDYHRNPNEKLTLRDFANFASFFPQIVAGPIERKHDLLPQLRNFRFSFTVVQVQEGIEYVIIGLFYKLVLADNIAASTGWILAPIDSPWLIHLGNLAFGLRIYFDFCGYSLIALGVANVLGIRLTVNFLAPYRSRNIQEFWRTWHISLSNWFRDYIYIPLGGNKRRVSLLVVFLVSGIWHGAGWNFVVWGLAHGGMLWVCIALRKKSQLWAPVAWGLTFFGVITSWLFFYETNVSQLAAKIATIADLQGYLGSPVRELLLLGDGYGKLIYLVFGLSIGIAVLILEAVSIRMADSQSPYQWARTMGVQAVLLIALVWLSPLASNGFVYFNF